GGGGYAGRAEGGAGAVGGRRERAGAAVRPMNGPAEGVRGRRYASSPAEPRAEKWVESVSTGRIRPMRTAIRRSALLAALAVVLPAAAGDPPQKAAPPSNTQTLRSAGQVVGELSKAPDSAGRDLPPQTPQ